VKVGAFEVSILVDAEGSFATVAEAFPTLSSNAPWRLPINAVLVRAPDATILVDTGVGPEPRSFMSGAGARLIDELARRGTRPEDVDVVVHTHLHVDHVGWDGHFPAARYVVHRDDWSFFMTSESLGRRPHLDEKLSPLEKAGRVKLLTGEADVAEGVRAVPTPGHTPGHMSVRLESGGERLIVLGDVVVHEAQVADPGLVYVSDEDAALAAETRKRVLAELADDGTAMIAGHFVGVGRVTRADGGFSRLPVA
jgi:glyoxylase-like metal-dependent hydrolase (beta-lactamase superfamily II)